MVFENYFYSYMVGLYYFYESIGFNTYYRYAHLYTIWISCVICIICIPTDNKITLYFIRTR